MENASKALIIAGAILLAILLISLGIMIFNQAQDTVTNSGMKEAEITAFNGKFLKYEGKQKGTMVKSLVQEVLANNASENNIERKVKVVGTGSGLNFEATENPTTTGISNNKTYTIELTYSSTGSNKGLVSLITIK